MCKMFAIIIVVIAAIVGIVVTVLPAEDLSNIVFLPKFFEAFLPILGAGALIKYLFTRHCSCGPDCACCNKDKGECHKAG